MTETALTTALNASYMADRLALFGIVVGVALLLSGLGFAILAIGGALRNPQSAFAMDWISADESLHLHNGMRWLGEGGLSEDEIDALLSRGQALLGMVMKQKDTSVKVFDSESAALAQADFYGPRRNPIAPISRQLGGFSDTQIDKLEKLASGDSDITGIELVPQKPQKASSSARV